MNACAHHLRMNVTISSAFRLLIPYALTEQRHAECGQIDRTYSIRQGFLYIFEGRRSVYGHGLGQLLLLRQTCVLVAPKSLI